MFDNFRDRLQAVQHDLTIGWKSIADKAKAVNKKLVRKTTFITDEIIVSDDQCFSCNLEAGAEILSKYQKEWAQLHETSRECAKRAQVSSHCFFIIISINFVIRLLSRCYLIPFL